MLKILLYCLVSNFSCSFLCWLLFFPLRFRIFSVISTFLNCMKCEVFLISALWYLLAHSIDSFSFFFLCQKMYFFQIHFSNISNHLKIFVLEISTLHRFREISVFIFSLVQIPNTWLFALIHLASIFVSFYLIFFTSLSFLLPFGRSPQRSFRSLTCPLDVFILPLISYSILYFTTVFFIFHICFVL